MATGLQFCLWTKGNRPIGRVEIGEVYRLSANEKNIFSVDKSCVGSETKNPEFTIDNARWAFIYNALFEDVKTKENTPNNLWGNLSGGKESVKKYGLGTNYSVGPKITFAPTGNSYYFGYKQRVELFSDSPGTGFYFYVVPITNNKIDYAYFQKSEDIKHYGETISLTICFHGYNLDNKNKYKTKVYLLEEKKAVGLTKTDDFEDNNLWKEPLEREILQKYSDDNWNTYLYYDFNIDIEWKKNDNKKKNFTVVVEVYRTYTEKGRFYGTNNKEERVAYRNFASNPTTDLVNYDSSILQLKDVDSKDSISSRFIVSEELMDQYLERIEREKTNMIQYIGDIRYTKKEDDPCGYSKILVQEDSNSERKPFTIFDEDSTDNVIDKTENVFAIIAGDERKEVSVILDKLTTKDVFCQGLLLDDGQKHTDKKNVFQIDKVYAAEKNKDGYHTTKDYTHQDQLKKAGIYSQTREKETDYDVIKSDKSYNPAESQNWKEGVDYEFKGDHKLTLKLNYLYNKTYESTFQKLLGYTADTINSALYTSVQSTAWIVRYMFLKEKYKQTFFIPISTCRYPNQIAKIEVYPDFEWWINVKYKTDAPIYVRQAPNYKYRVFTTEENQNQRLAGANRTEQSKNWKFKEKKYELDFEAGYKINGQEYSLIPGDGFPLLNAIRFFLRSYEIFKELSFADETEESELSIANGTARTSDGREPERRMTQRWQQRKAKGFPFRIDVTMPSLSGGIYGKFAQSKNTPSSIGSFYSLEFAAKPLFGIEGKLDLLYFAQFIGPIGQAMYRISEVVKKVNYLTLGAVKIDYFLYIGAKADLNIELKALEYHSVDGWGSGEVQVYAPIEVWLESGVDVNVSIQGIGKADVGITIKGEVKLEMRATYDKRQNKSPAFIKFNGLDAKIWVKFSAKSETNGDTEDPDDEPDFLKTIINPKDPWKIDIL